MRSIHISILRLIITKETCTAQAQSRYIENNTWLLGHMKFPFLYLNRYLTIFRRFPTIFRRFLMFFECCPKSYERFRTFFELFRTFPKISEDNRRLPRKIRRCFDLVPTHFGSFSIKTANLSENVTSSISQFLSERICCN